MIESKAAEKELPQLLPPPINAIQGIRALIGGLATVIAQV